MFQLTNSDTKDGPPGPRFLSFHPNDYIYPLEHNREWLENFSYLEVHPNITKEYDLQTVDLSVLYLKRNFLKSLNSGYLFFTAEVTYLLFCQVL